MLIISVIVENFLTESRLFDAPAGISGSRLRAPRRRLCRGTRHAAEPLWRFPLSPLASPLLISASRVSELASASQTRLQRQQRPDSQERLACTPLFRAEEVVELQPRRIDGQGGACLEHRCCFYRIRHRPAVESSVPKQTKTWNYDAIKLLICKFSQKKPFTSMSNNYRP